MTWRATISIIKIHKYTQSNSMESTKIEIDTPLKIEIDTPLKIEIDSKCDT